MKRVAFKILLVVLMMSIPSYVYATDGQFKIGQTSATTFPIQITQSGSYVLTSNLIVPTNVNGIEINASNVTLDLNGHAVVGPGKTSGTSGKGIYANTTRNNIAVTNGTIRDFREYGVGLEGGNNQVKDVNAYSNGGGAGGSTIGIAVWNGVVTNCTANNNNVGIYADNSIVTNCTANKNLYGIFTMRSIVSNCTTIENTNDGIGFYVYSTITNCSSINNGGSGINAGGLGGARVVGNHICDNNTYGIDLGINGGNYVIKNSLCNNTAGNFHDGGGIGNYMPICGVDATDNCNYGF